MKSLFRRLHPWEWLRYQARLIKAGAKRSNPMFVGVGATKLFLVVVVLIALGPQYTDKGWSWRLSSILTAPFNEIGGSLAGIAGALAFLWIIVTVMMQSKELAAQREELDLTRQEFEKISQAQNEQVKFMEHQTFLMESQREEKTKQARGQIFEIKVTDLRSAIMELATDRIHLILPDGQSKKISVFDQMAPETRGKGKFSELSLEDLLETMLRCLDSIDATFGATNKPSYPKEMFKIWRLTVSCSEMIELIDPYTREKYMKARLPTFAEALNPLKDPYE